MLKSSAFLTELADCVKPAFGDLTKKIVKMVYESIEALPPQERSDINRQYIQNVCGSGAYVTALAEKNPETMRKLIKF